MSDFESKIYRALHEAVLSLYELDMDETVLVVETPKDTRLGDYATSAAMKLARSLRKNPIEIAGQLAGRLTELLPEAESISVARPGFINFKLKNTALSALINQVIDAGEHYGENESGKLLGAGLDGVEREPLQPDDELFTNDNIIVTPHVGGGTADIGEAIMPMLVEDIRLFLNGESPKFVVNRQFLAQ